MQTEKNEYLCFFCLGMKHVDEYHSIYLYYLITHFLFKLTSAKGEKLFDFLSSLDFWICRIIKLPWNKKSHKQIIVISISFFARMSNKCFTVYHRISCNVWFSIIFCILELRCLYKEFMLRHSITFFKRKNSCGNKKFFKHEKNYNKKLFSTSFFTFYSNGGCP